jgi:hypothetical protein
VGAPPCQGESFGATYVKSYHHTIAALYARGNANKACKVSPDQVREQLVRSHPESSVCRGCGRCETSKFPWTKRNSLATRLVAVGASMRPRFLLMCALQSTRLLRLTPALSLPQCLRV